MRVVLLALAWIVVCLALTYAKNTYWRFDADQSIMVDVLIVIVCYMGFRRTAKFMSASASAKSDANERTKPMSESTPPQNRQAQTRPTFNESVEPLNKVVGADAPASDAIGTAPLATPKQTARLITGGVWISRRMLFGGGIVAALTLVLVLVVWAILARGPIREITSTPRFTATSPPTWETAGSEIRRQYPDVPEGELKGMLEQARNRTGDDVAFARRVQNMLFPELVLAEKTSSKGELRGRVHNGTNKGISEIKMRILSKKWERIYTVKVTVASQTTEVFTIFVGDKLLSIESVEVVSTSYLP